MILAIDPGNEASGYVLICTNYRPILQGKLPNEELLSTSRRWGYDALVVEMVGHYGKGMPAGKTVFDTCVWIGRFIQEAAQRKIPAYTIMRGEEKINLCGSAQAKDANIRQALIDRFAVFDKKNGKGTKTKPDVFYGFSKDIWSAYAVGTTWLDMHQEGSA